MTLEQWMELINEHDPGTFGESEFKRVAWFAAGHMSDVYARLTSIAKRENESSLIDAIAIAMHMNPIVDEGDFRAWSEKVIEELRSR